SILLPLPTAVLTLQPNWTQIFMGESVTMICNIQEGDVTDWKYTWRQSYNNVYKDFNSTENEQKIYAAVISDTCHYRCYGTSRHAQQNSMFSNTVSLTVIALPMASVSVTPHGFLYSGETVTLQCDISDYKDWTYRWYLNYYSLLYVLFLNMSLMSMPLGYVCVFQVLPKTTPTVTPNPAYPGETVTLTCSVGSYSDWRYKWYKDRNDTVVSLSGSSNPGASYTISRTSVSRTSTGVKDTECLDPHLHNQVLTLLSLPAAVLTLQPNWPQIFMGEIVTMICNIQVGDVTDWTYSQTNYKDFVTTKNKHKINATDLSDSVEYTCLGTNRHNLRYSLWSNTVNLTVTGKSTTLIVNLNPLYHEETVVLTCSVESETDWRYKWYEDSNDIVVSLSDRHTVTGDTHTINRAAESDQGLYWCQGERDSRPKSTSISQPVTVNGELYTAPETIKRQMQLFLSFPKRSKYIFTFLFLTQNLPV
uniref:Ig-like domain-containing protein n=1 Tax=Esox lucius TaxID=8010 RepID=A0AAY5KZC8_ESOLU